MPRREMRVRCSSAYARRKEDFQSIDMNTTISANSITITPPTGNHFYRLLRP